MIHKTLQNLPVTTDICHSLIINQTTYPIYWGILRHESNAFIFTGLCQRLYATPLLKWAP